MTDATAPDPKPGRNARADLKVVLGCTVFFSSMFGMAYAAVPLYQWFCQVTGFGGTTQVAEVAPAEVLDRTINVRFDANVARGLPWGFRPMQREVEVRIGEVTEVAYRSENRGEATTVGTASYNVTPAAAGAYFHKMDCFCFTEQALAAGEGVDMPIVFYVDPDIVETFETRGLDTVTLSYTFFPVDEPETVAAVSGQ